MRLLALLADRPRLAALLGALSIASSGIFYRYAAVSPETGAFFRALYGLPLLGLVAWAEVRRFGPLPRRAVAAAAAAGCFFAADLALWHHAIEAVGVGLATVLANLQVVLVGAVAWWLGGERPSRAVLASLPLVLVGVVAISGVLETGAYGADPVAGVVLGLGAAAAYAAYLLVMRRVGGRASGPALPVFVSTAATAGASLAVGLLVGRLDLGPSWPAHGWLAVLGLTAQAAGYLFIVSSLPRLPAVVASILLLAQPVGSVALGIILLGEAPSLLQSLGVGLVLAGIAVAGGPGGRLGDAVRTRLVGDARASDEAVDGVTVRSPGEAARPR
ncbi:MAG TPA: DMT family transporter [Candidatus Binatia bacterium]|nr:DMT family transporter [Candidatus Binatia bacterium]